MKKINTYKVAGLFVLMCGIALASAPQTTWAATSKPTCAMSVTQGSATTRVYGSSPILVSSDVPIGISWESNHATKAVDQNKRTIALSGTATVTPQRNTAYTVTVSRGSSKATCKISVLVVTGNITLPETGTISARPTLSGRVRGVSSITLNITPVGTTTPLFMSDSVRVRNGKWSQRITTTLPDGNYQVAIMGENRQNSLTIATSTLQIGSAPITNQFSPTVVVVPVPLLIGGVARPGASVAVAYLQIINIGNATATLAGFTLNQTGTAPLATVVGLTAVTDNGVARGSVGNMLTGTPFANSSAFVPLQANLAPREMRLVTIKAVMSPVLLPYLGTTLTLRVAGVSGNLKSQAAWPLFGTVWTMGAQ